MNRQQWTRYVNRHIPVSSDLPRLTGEGSRDWALWRLSLVLKAISENSEPPCQGLVEDRVTGGDGECKDGGEPHISHK
jgi:hypothetical protein